MRVIVALITALSLSACTITPWGLGLNTEKAPPEDTTANGLIVILGDEAFARASARLTNTVKKNWPQGLVLEGNATLEGDSIGLGSLTIEYEELWLELGLIDVQSYEDSFGVQVSIESPYVKVRVLDGDEEICSETLAFHGLIDSRISLGQDKYGQVQSTMIDAAIIGVEKTNEDFGPCDYALGPVLFHDAMQEVGQSLATDVSMTVGPTLEESMPKALGLNLAMDYAVALGDNPAELGMGRGRIRASSVANDNFWSYVDGRVVVPFSVSLDSEQALCVPEEPLAHPPAKLIPPMEEKQDTVLLVNASVAAKALKVAWQTGLVCDDRLASSIDVPVQSLRTIWPALETFGSDAQLTVRIWPRDNPQIEFLSLDDSAFLHLETGLVRVEVMVEYDETWLRVATLEVEVEVEGPLLIDPNGSVLLDPINIAVVTVNAFDGLHRSPNFEAIEAMTKALTRSVLADRALLQLPPFATEAGMLGIELDGDYLSFNKIAE